MASNPIWQSIRRAFPSLLTLHNLKMILVRYASACFENKADGRDAHPTKQSKSSRNYATPLYLLHSCKANMSDDLSLIELLSHNRDYFRALAGQYPEDYHPAGQRVSPGYNHRSSAKGIYANPD